MRVVAHPVRISAYVVLTRDRRRVQGNRVRRVCEGWRRSAKVFNEQEFSRGLRGCTGVVRFCGEVGCPGVGFRRRVMIYYLLRRLFFLSVDISLGALVGSIF